MKRLLSENPLAGTKTYFEANNGKYIITEQQEVDAILRENQRVRNQTDRHTRHGEWSRVAQIPMLLWHQMNKDGRLKDQRHMRRWLNDYDNRVFRTRQGKSMSIASYTDLLSQVENWIDRTDLTALIPDFVVLAEAQLNRSLRHRKMIERNGSFVLNAQYVAVPSNWLQTVQITLNTSPVRPLESVSKDQINQMRRDYADTGEPQFFATVGEEFEFFPTPSSETAELIYYRTIPPLASNDPNWLLTLSPDIYLHATILQAQLYVQDEEEAQKTSGLLGSLLESMNVANQRSQGDSSMRVRTQGFV